MQCSKPIFLKEKGLEVPCGKCINCRVSRSREWTIRLMNELQYYKTSLFVTLTYDDEHLPSDNGLHISDLQKYFKRLRRDLDYSNRKIKYFACGEYGDQFGRPH